MWILGGNSVNLNGVLGTTTNYPLYLVVNSQNALRLFPNATSPNIIGGYSGNNMQNGVVGSVIAGGGNLSDINTIYDNYNVIGGGNHNIAGSNDGDPLRW